MHTYPTQAVVLAGGQGSRLRPCTEAAPSRWSRSREQGTPIIGHQLSWLGLRGRHRRRDLVRPSRRCPAGVAGFRRLPLRVTTVVETEPLGRGGGSSMPRPRPPAPDRALVRDQRRHLDPLLAAGDGRLPRRAGRHGDPRPGPTADPVGRRGDDAFGHITGLHRVAAVAVLINAACTSSRRVHLDAAGPRRPRTTTFPRLAREPGSPGSRCPTAPTGGPSTPPRTSPRPRGAGADAGT